MPPDNRELKRRWKDMLAEIRRKQVEVSRHMALLVAKLTSHQKGARDLGIDDIVGTVAPAWEACRDIQRLAMEFQTWADGDEVAPPEGKTVSQASSGQQPPEEKNTDGIPPFRKEPRQS